LAGAADCGAIRFDAGAESQPLLIRSSQRKRRHQLRGTLVDIRKHLRVQMAVKPNIFGGCSGNREAARALEQVGMAPPQDGAE
jgi:hypothetical protein